MKKKLHVSMTADEVWMGFLYLAVQLVVLPVLLQRILEPLHLPDHHLWLNMLFYCLNFIFILVIFRGFLGKSLVSAGKHVWVFIRSVLLGFVIYWAANLVMTWVIYTFLPDFTNANDTNVVQLMDQSFPLIAFATIVLVPPVEECLYRGLIFRGLHTYSRPGAYILSALAFAAIHVMGYIGAFDNLTLAVCYVQYLPAGLCLAWAYEQADSIFAPILIHAAINAVGIFALR